MEAEENVNQLAGHLFRHEAGRMAAVLTRLLGFQNMELAEDIVQESLLKAMSVWRYQGIPENPSAWLYRTAKNKAIDLLRKQSVFRKIESDLARELQSEWTLSSTVSQLFLDAEIEDSQLRMIFACCHPAIPYESQIALTLKTLCGLSVEEIANAFLTTDETIAKRIYRAKEKIRMEQIDLSTPPALLENRLDAVLHTLYLLFNEGYNATHAEVLIREDLCAEAIRLCLLLTQNQNTNLPRTRALLALFCFQASRLDARISENGGIVLLKYQDRKLWNRQLIERGQAYLGSSAVGEKFCEYHLEAAIAACHCLAPSFEQTDWRAILNLYELLNNLKPGPVVEMNKAIALGFAESPEKGLAELEKVKGLEQNQHYHAALGEFQLQVGEKSEAKLHFEKAQVYTHSIKEREFLATRIAAAL